MEWTKDQQAEHRRLLVEALRSGKYQQAREKLIGEVVTYDTVTGEQNKTGKVGYCCLGVGCIVAKEHGMTELMIEVGLDNGHVRYPEGDTDLDEQFDGEPPMDVMAFFGFVDSGGTLDRRWDIDLKQWEEPNDAGSGNYADSLISLNDDARFSFSEIADVIEQGIVRLQA